LNRGQSQAVLGTKRVFCAAKVEILGIKFYSQLT
jgi:hypothetical protein